MAPPNSLNRAAKVLLFPDLCKSSLASAVDIDTRYVMEILDLPQRAIHIALAAMLITPYNRTQ